MPIGISKNRNTGRYGDPADAGDEGVVVSGRCTDSDGVGFSRNTCVPNINVIVEAPSPRTVLKLTRHPCWQAALAAGPSPIAITPSPSRTMNLPRDRRTGAHVLPLK
jgi:hypothetical protein